LAIATAGKKSAALLLYSGFDGALKSKPESIALSGAARALAMGILDDSGEYTLAAAAGSDVTMIHPRTLDGARSIEHVGLPFATNTLVAGRFSGNVNEEFAAASSLGRIEFIRKVDGAWSVETSAAGVGFNPVGMIRARVAGTSHDDLVALDSTTRGISVLMNDSRKSIGDRLAAAGTSNRPVALMATNLRKGMGTDIGALTGGGVSAPIALLFPSPNNVYAVDHRSDTDHGGVCVATQCTLRDAINVANATVGPDEIIFDPAVTFVQPGSALPTIADP